MIFKREHKRTRIKIPAAYRTEASPNIVINITLKDISASGLAFESGEPLLPTTQIIISIYVKDENKNIILKAKTMWCREDPDDGKYISGVTFIETSTPDFQTFLGFYCRQILDL